jgi:hypothetical protein
MKTRLAGIAIAVLSAACAAGGAAAQTSGAASESGNAAAQAGQASASATQAASVSAELTKKIDSKDAKVGDQVVAKTTSEARLADGTKLPKGSKLEGHVTEVEAKSHDNHDGRLAFCFDHAVLKDGREVPVNSMVRSIAAPAPAAEGSGPDVMGGGMQGGGGMRGGGGAGLAGNGPVRSATSSVTGTAAGAAGGVNGASSGIDGSVNGAMNANGALGTGANGTLNDAGLNGGLAAGPMLPVGNLSGVTFATVRVEAAASNGGVSAAGGASTATMLTAHNKNVSLDSGSTMTISAVPR